MIFSSTSRVRSQSKAPKQPQLEDDTVGPMRALPPSQPIHQYVRGHESNIRNEEEKNRMSFTNFVKSMANRNESAPQHGFEMQDQKIQNLTFSRNNQPGNGQENI